MMEGCECVVIKFLCHMERSWPGAKIMKGLLMSTLYSTVTDSAKKTLEQSHTHTHQNLSNYR